MSDPDFSKVVLLLSFDGLDGAVVTADKSPANHLPTFLANAQIDTAQSKFGGSSCLFDGVDDAISFSDSNDWRLSAANSDQFTVEGWVRFSSVSGDRHFMGQWIAANLGWNIRKQSGGELQFGWSTDGSNSFTVVTAGANFVINTWYHFAVEKNSSGKIRIYIDGVMLGSSTPADSSIFNSTSALIIGEETTRDFAGWFDDIRITKGLARYDSDAGFAVPSAAYPTFGPTTILPARYWMLQISANNGDGVGTAISELKFFDSSGTQISTVGGTPTASSIFSASYPASKAFDGVTTGFVWLSSGIAATQWIKMDFGAGNEKDVAYVEMATESGQPTRGPRLFRLKYSNDDVDYTTKFDIVDIMGPTGNGVRAWNGVAFYAFPPPLKRDWRIRTDTTYLTSRINVAVAEFEFALGAAGADQSVVASPVYGELQWYSSNTPALAVDDNTGTYWATNVGATVAAPQYYHVQFSTAKNISEIRLRSRNDTFHDQIPATGEVHYSDGTGGWVSVGTFNFTADGSSAGQVHTLTTGLAVPDLVSVSPVNGPLAGGTAVTLTGTTLLGTTDVKFGGVSATSIVVVNSTTITCVTPAHAVGLVNVDIFNPAGNDTLVNGFTYQDLQTIVTQTPLLVLDASNQAIRVTQVPMLILYQEKQPTRVTQTPLLVLYEPKPVPLPGPVVPETSVSESWIWKTAISSALTSKEQRSRLREVPRYKMQFSVLILDEEDRVRIYNLLMRFLKTTFTYPLYQYCVQLDQDAAVGATKLFCDTTKTDVRAGEFVALYDPQLEETTYLLCTTVDVDGVNLSVPLTSGAFTYMQLCPAIDFRIMPTVGLNMRSVDGDMSITMESVKPRIFQRPGATPTLATIDSILVVPERPLANDEVPENFDMGNEWFDNGTSVPEVFNEWTNPQTKSTRKYEFDRRVKVDYWRAVCDTLKGRQNVALFPTFRNDLPLRDPMVLNSTSFTTDNINFFLWYLDQNFRYLAINTANGMKYRRVSSVEPHYDANGDPYYLTVKLTASTGNIAGDNVISSISYMNLCRLDSDEVKLTHYEVDTDIEFAIKAVNR